MKRIDSPGATVDNKFTDGDPGLGIEATVLHAEWHNNVQEEICLAIEGMGLTLNGADPNQLYDALIATFSPLGHNHDGVYEPAFAKATAFNKSFGTTAGTVAQGNHNHAGVYEPAFAKATAFNKNFGRSAGTVAEGHNLPPVGAEMFWPTNTPPAGWLEENGAAISRTTYAALFAVIGTTYGAGDGSTTFNIPDARGEIIRVWDHGVGRDPDRFSRTNSGGGVIGDNVGTRQGDDLRDHNHVVVANSYEGGAGGTAAGPGWSSENSQVFSNYGIASAYFGGNETRPRNVYRMMIIKY